MRTTKAGRAWLLFFNLVAIALVIVLTEAYLRSRDSGSESRSSRLEFSNPELHHSDDTFGVRPAPNTSTKARFTHGDELIYEVTYTTDSHGLRVSPPTPGEPSKRCVLFFGGSFMWGTGVEDDESLPYQVGIKTGGLYGVRNFGFGGYGPHQMLAAIKSGFVDRAAQCRPEHAIYLALPEHVMRVAGKTRIARNGPRFVVGADGSVRRDGSFGDEAAPWWPRFLWSLSLGRRAFDSREATEADFELFYTVVQRSRDLLDSHYPGIEFHALHWDLHRPELFAEEVQANGIIVHRIGRILPDGRPTEYTIDHDGHPNARAYGLLADYVVSEILKETAD